MKLFPCAHATHPQWAMAAGLVLAQLRARMALADHADAPTLGLLYITDHFAGAAQDILDHLMAQLPQVTDWVGTVGVGIAAGGVEYFDEPAIAVLLCDLPPHRYRVFSGVAPLAAGAGFIPNTALLHADGGTPDLGELIAELAQRTTSGYLFGGLASSRGDTVQFAVGGNGNLRGRGLAQGVFRGGFSGVAFDAGVRLVSRVTQGCQAVAPERIVTACDGHVVMALDGQPALPVLLSDLAITLEEPEGAVERLRTTLVGLAAGDRRTFGRGGSFGTDTRVRHLIGLDPARQGIAVAERVEPGMRLTFCRRDAAAARADLVRICAEVREELEPESLPAPLAAARMAGDPVEGPPAGAGIAGAIYISCAGRGGPHFGAPNAELLTVRRALGDVPLVGFFAGGEVAHHHLYGYTGVLTVFPA